ncbi:MAG TPA: MFS transporter [Bryobacteraceae bacterium]|jgi:ACS family glucarate transporter-like MFS transporter|nr:MFS transporter [Bryobacteraceae bacterium]
MKSFHARNAGRGRDLGIVGMLFGFSMVSYFDRTIISIAGPSMMHEFDLSATRMGAVYSAFIFGYALFMIPGGHLADRLGPRRTLAIMGWSSAAFTALIVLGGSPGIGAYAGIVPALVLIRFALGAVTAPLYPACARMTANWIPLVYHARVQGLIIAGSSAGAAIAPIAFTWLMRMFQWRASFGIAAGVTAVLAAIWQWQARDHPNAPANPVTPSVEAGRPSWLKLFSNRNLMLLTFAYGALGYFQYIFFYWMYYYFGDVLHLGAQTSAAYTTALFLTEGAIMPVGGLVSDRLTLRYGAQFGRRIVPIAGLTLGAILIYSATITSGVPAVVCLSLAFGFAACCEGPFWATVTEMAGERVGGASSILNAGAQVGGFFAPILTPWIASRAGWAAALYAGGLAALSAVAAIYFIQLRPARTTTGLVSESVLPA